MSEQYLSFRDASLSTMDLILDDTDDDEETLEANSRLTRYVRLGRMVDRDDIAILVGERFSASPELMGLIDDCLSDPPDPTRVRIHPAMAMRVALAVLREAADAIDDQIAMMDATREGD